MTALILICAVVGVHDADTVRCQDGTRVRIAAVNAREADGSCNHTPCPVMRHEQAQPIAAGLMLGRTVQFSIVGRSGKRLVGENYAIRCRLIQIGAATSWEQYRVRYGLRRCG